MKVVPLEWRHLEAAAALVAAGIERSRRCSPIVPDRLADPAVVREQLEEHFKTRPGLVAEENGHLLGFIGWFVVPRFRGTARTGAYVPEWCRGFATDRVEQTHRALYRVAAAAWTDDGCGVHAVTLPSSEDAEREAWFRNGFGLTVVDSIRAVSPIAVSPPVGVEVRRADAADVEALAALDVESAAYFARPPVLMRREVDAAGEFLDFMSRPRNAVWIASVGDELVGAMRFNGEGGEGAAMLHASDRVSITGAHVRSAFRRRGIGTAILNAALTDLATRGFTRCSVEFESFNPEAATFWPRLFAPVAHSLVRAPEFLPGG